MKTAEYYSSRLRAIVRGVEREPSRQAKRATVRRLGLEWKQYLFLRNEAKKKGLIPTAFDKGGKVIARQG